MASLPPGLARTIARFHFARDLLGREKSRCRRPELGDLARLASHAAHPLAIAAIAVAERDAAVVAIADRDFAGVGHRTDKSGCDPEDLIAHRHQVDRAPRLQKRPCQSFTLRNGAPFFAKVCRILVMPLSHGPAQP